MVKDKSFCTSMSISLLIHLLLIILLPGISPVEPEDNRLGSYTRVQLIYVPVAPKEKKGTVPKGKGDLPVPVPEMAPSVRKRLTQIGQIPLPNLDLDLPTKEDRSFLPSTSEIELEEDLIEEEMIEEMEEEHDSKCSY